MLKDDIVLVTGSSRGIGRSIALAFAKQGAKVVLNSGHDSAQLESTLQSFHESGYTATSFFGDLSQFSIAEQLFKHIHTTYGKSPTIVINNAGISHVGLFTDTSPDMWSKVININLNSAYHCCYLAAPDMIKNHKGIIINISSIWGKVGASCEVAYSTSKGALNAFTKALAKELGPSAIRVNALACGWIDTAMTNCYTPEEKDAFVEEIPLCRTGTPEEVANACLFLASNQSSYITGQVLTLDGGLL